MVHSNYARMSATQPNANKFRSYYVETRLRNAVLEKHEHNLIIANSSRDHFYPPKHRFYPSLTPHAARAKPAPRPSTSTAWTPPPSRSTLRPSAHDHCRVPCHRRIPPLSLLALSGASLGQRGPILGSTCPPRPHGSFGPSRRSPERPDAGDSSTDEASAAVIPFR
jgi:hypothetical protein